MGSSLGNWYFVGNALGYATGRETHRGSKPLVFSSNFLVNFLSPLPRFSVLSARQLADQSTPEGQKVEPEVGLGWG